MYDGKVEIAAMAPYNRSEYYRESLSELAEAVTERIDSCYYSGFTFMRALKLIIAQIAAKDWTDIDSKRVAMTVDILRRNLTSAVHMGCLSVTDTNEELRVLDNFNTQEGVPDFPVAVGESSISSNTTDFCDDDEEQRLQLEANVALGKVKQGLSVCGCKCSVCFWRCVMEKGHGDRHSCMGSHLCTENCSYCTREGDSLSLCGDLAGHEGNHNCKRKNHTCGQSCYLYETSSNCNEKCSLWPGQPGQHKCDSPQHMCNRKCSLPSCINPCVVAIESNHKAHQCNEKYCPTKCTINGCSSSFQSSTILEQGFIIKKPLQEVTI
ncbi:hypothetical protein SUGI_1429010 [Cryptomeria japonica]|uniref:Uncharacterized protein n=1 Tax=Cryptomeria japonica TaxID=3369 RepID=A0AAD3NT17_CRYJA|nr:hypothetical protein SUGI_1429010 [Cryptomeria japonica]